MWIGTTMYEMFMRYATGLSGQWESGVDLGPSGPYWQFFHGCAYGADAMIFAFALALAYGWLSGE